MLDVMSLLMLHAFPLDERMWDRQADSLRPQRVIAPRLYGRGRSFDDVGRSLLRELAGEVVAVGASMGGYAALAIARAEPQRLKALVLVGSRAESDSPQRSAARTETIARLKAEGSAAVWAPDDLASAPSCAELIAAVEALRDRPDATETIRRLQCPFLVIVGEDDPLMTVDEGEALATLAPDGRFKSIAGAGHLPSVDRPAEFDSSLRAFLNSI